MSDDRQITLQICDVPPSDAETYAAELRQKLLETARGVTDVQIRSAGENTQDGGALLVLLLGTPFAVEVGKGIAKALEAFVTRRTKAVVVVKKPDGTEVRVSSDSVDAAAIAQSLRT